MSNKYLVVEAVSNTASFRIPEFHNYHKTLPLPPVTTIVGIVGAALGKNYQEAQEYFERNVFEIGVYGTSTGHFIDLWKAKKWKGSKPKITDRTIIQREFRANNYYIIIFGNSSMIIDELKTSFENCVFALTAGNSDSLLKISKLSILSEPEKSITSKFENCILSGNYIDTLELDLEINKKYVFTPMNSPSCYNLPNSFIFFENNIRKIKERKEFTFVGNSVKSKKYECEAIRYSGKLIPIFNHII
jgi:CRISPR-associated protein Cas5t